MFTQEDPTLTWGGGEGSHLTCNLLQLFLRELLFPQLLLLTLAHADNVVGLQVRVGEKALPEQAAPSAQDPRALLGFPPSPPSPADPSPTCRSCLKPVCRTGRNMPVTLTWSPGCTRRVFSPCTLTLMERGKLPTGTWSLCEQGEHRQRQTGESLPYPQAPKPSPGIVPSCSGWSTLRLVQSGGIRLLLVGGGSAHHPHPLANYKETRKISIYQATAFLPRTRQFGHGLNTGKQCRNSHLTPSGSQETGMHILWGQQKEWVSAGGASTIGFFCLPPPPDNHFQATVQVLS